MSLLIPSTIIATIFAASISANAFAEIPAGQLDFELAGASDFVRLSELPAKTTLVNFWRFDCPACVQEMPLLYKTAQSNTLRVIAVAVQRPSETLAAPASIRPYLGEPLQLLHAPSNASGLLARFGNRNQVLPYTVMLNPQRQVCAVKSGEINQGWINQAASLCQ